MWDTTNIKTKYKKRERYPDTFGELPLTGVLPGRDSEIRGEIHIKKQPNGYGKGTKVKAGSSCIGKLKR